MIETEIGNRISKDDIKYWRRANLVLGEDNRYRLETKSSNGWPMKLFYQRMNGENFKTTQTITSIKTKRQEY